MGGIRPCLFLLPAIVAHALVSVEGDSAGGVGRIFHTEDPIRFHIYAHHKAGTALSAALVKVLEYVLSKHRKIDIKRQAVKWRTIAAWTTTWNQTEMICPRLGHSCAVLYEDMRVETFQLIQKNCPARAVHLIRNGQSQLVSNYVYSKHLASGDELSFDVKFGRGLREHSVKWGLKSTCDLMSQAYFPQMIGMHRYLQQSLPDNVLEVQYEDFEQDFDGTVRRIFTHFLGTDARTEIEELARLAALSNLDNWNDEKQSQHPHLRSREEKRHVRELLSNITEEELPGSCLRKIADVSTLLGYDVDGNVIEPGG